VNTREPIEALLPISANDHWTTVKRFAGLSAGVGAAIALAVLALSYVRVRPDLDWIMPFVWVILATGIWLAFLVITQFLNSQWVLAQTFAEWLEWRESRRKVAEAAAQPVTIQTNNGVAVNNGTIVQNNYRIVTLRTERRLIEGIPEAALAFFIDQYEIRGWSQRAWVDQNMRLPGLNREVDYELWRQLVGLVEKVEGIPPVAPRTKIKPTAPLGEIKQRLLGPVGEVKVIPETDVD
jgi:hypothetical protein